MTELYVTRTTKGNTANALCTCTSTRAAVSCSISRSVARPEARAAARSCLDSSVGNCWTTAGTPTRPVAT